MWEYKLGKENKIGDNFDEWIKVYEHSISYFFIKDKDDLSDCLSINQLIN